MLQVQSERGHRTRKLGSCALIKVGLWSEKKLQGAPRFLTMKSWVPSTYKLNNYMTKGKRLVACGTWALLEHNPALNLPSINNPWNLNQHSLNVSISTWSTLDQHRGWQSVRNVLPDGCYTVLNLGSRCPGLSPGCGRCVMVLCKILTCNSCSVCHHLGVIIGYLGSGG